MKVKDITKGTIFCETCYGHPVTFEAIEDARRIKDDPTRFDGWEVIAKIIKGDKGNEGNLITFGASDSHLAYAPNLTLIKKG